MLAFFDGKMKGVGKNTSYELKSDFTEGNCAKNVVNNDGKTTTSYKHTA